MRAVYVPFLIFVAFALSTCMRELPQTMLVDPSFTVDLQRSIRQAVDTINTELGEALVGFPIVFIGGYASPDDKFTPEKFQDDRHVIYNMDMLTQDYLDINSENFESPADGVTYGYGTSGDVLLFTITLPTGEAMTCASCGKCASTTDHVALHELGHFVGMGHTEDPSSVMFKWTIAPIVSFNRTDRQDFCASAPCIVEP